MFPFLYLKVVQHGPNGGFGRFQSWDIVLIVIPILVISFVVYRLFLPELKKVKRTEYFKEIVTKTQTKNMEYTNDNKDTSVDRKAINTQQSPIEIALRLLEADEKQVVKALLDAGGSMLQKEISWNTGFSRVKTHRILVRLLRRGVVTSEKYYNTNKITLSKWLLTQEDG